MAAQAAAVVIGAAVTAYSVNRAHEAANTQKRAQLTALKEQSKLLKAMNPEVGKTAARDAQALQRQQAASAFGYRDTILTTPLGLTSGPAGQRRTLLGG